MQLVLENVHVQGRRESLLSLDRLTLTTGECVLLAGEPGQGHTALALVLTGRLAPYTGRVRLVREDGSQTAKATELRRRSAVVDLPAVSAPDEAVRVGTVTAEDLALARRFVWPGTAGSWLSAQRLASLQHKRVDALPGPVRTALLTALAVERKGVRFVVLTLPDRHGGDPAQWWAIAQAYAAVGYGVLVQCGRSSARDLGVTLPPAHHGSDLRATPVEVMRLRPQPEARQPVSAPAGGPSGPPPAGPPPAVPPPSVPPPSGPPPSGPPPSYPPPSHPPPSGPPQGAPVLALGPSGSGDHGTRAIDQRREPDAPRHREDER